MAHTSALSYSCVRWRWFSSSTQNSKHACSMAVICHASTSASTTSAASAAVSPSTTSIGLALALGPGTGLLLLGLASHISSSIWPAPANVWTTLNPALLVRASGLGLSGAGMASCHSACYFWRYRGVMPYAGSFPSYSCY
ncbi:hypothetical protein BJX66DRAFT_344713 [Aspergillus keveii]|uniref:Uncharacterized protein n=1 Tax=Aspergillus keveii TaxID=714993 RepID=A0ABR4FKB0_9EURO